MDELTILKAFRAETTGAGCDDAARERTMAAIRVLIEKETATVRAPRARYAPARRRVPRIALSRRRLSVVALLAAVIAATVAVLPTRQSSPSLVGQALAAIGSGSVLHIIGETPS